MKFKALIFDFNGVLLWDIPWHEIAWKQASKEIRGHELTDEEFDIYINGRTNKSALSYLKGRDVDGEELLSLINYKENTYREIAIKQKDFMLSPGAIELLNLAKAKDLPFTIATSSEITNLEFFYKNLKLSEWFSFDKISYDDGIVAGKPAPDIYLKAAEKLGIKPQECIVIEDAKSGVEAAYNAGIGKIIAIGPREKHENLGKLKGVSEVIANLGEVAEKFNCLF